MSEGRRMYHLRMMLVRRGHRSMMLLPERAQWQISKLGLGGIGGEEMLMRMLVISIAHHLGTSLPRTSTLKGVTALLSSLSLLTHPKILMKNKSKSRYDQKLGCRRRALTLRPRLRGRERKLISTSMP